MNTEPNFIRNDSTAQTGYYQSTRSVEALRPDAERLTVWADAGQPELLELCEGCHFGRNVAAQLVGAEIQNFKIREWCEQLEYLLKRRPYETTVSIFSCDD